MMRYFLTLYWALLAYILTASEASAGPVFVALMANGAAFGAAVSATAVGTFLSTIGGRLLSSVALSALQRALGPKTKQNASGITTSSTATGGTNPVGFVLGSYATAGDAVAPPMTHGKSGKTPNAYLTYVIALGDVAGQTLDRVAINGAWVDITETVNGDYGNALAGIYFGYAWVKYYDGSQTAADPMLLAKYGSYPERPWLSDMIGTGVPYVIFTFRYNREVFTEFPAVLIQCGGIKLYDPRKDSTVGGSGAHRWGQPATYQSSTNPIVMAYNISRGIEIAGLGVWGGEIEAVDLPNASWFSGMNTCDITAGTPAVAQYRAGYEVRVDMEPAAVMEELLKGCAGQIAEVGGEFKVRVGGPGMPVMFLTDDDIVVSKAQDYDPFPQADGRQNGIDAKYPDPAVMWVAKSAPSRYNAAWELEDGERRVVSLDLPACPYPDQVQRIMDAYIADERRFRRHNMTLPPDAAILEPLDVISWTSARNSYTAKQFDLSQLADDVNTGLQRVSVREVNAADFVFTGTLIPAPTPSPTPVVVAAQTLDSWDAQPLSVGDGTGTPRKPGIVMTWSATDMDAVDAVQYQVRVKDTGIIVKIGTVSAVSSGRIPLTEGIVQGVTYQAQGLPVAPGRAVAWTGWVDVTAPSVGISTADLSAALATTINDTVAAATAAQNELDQLTAGLVTEVNGALAAIEARTKAGLKGWLSDPIFSRWTSGNLTAAYWWSRSGVTTYGTKVAGLFGSAISVNVPTGTGVVQFIAHNDAGMIAANPDEPYLVMTLIIDMTAGNLSDAALRVEWSPDGTVWTRGDMLGLSAPFGTFAQLGVSLKPGVLQTIEALVKRPAGTFSYVRLVANPKTNAVTTAHQSVWHLMQARPATQADIDAGQLYTVAGVTAGSTQTVAGIGAAMAAVNTGLTAQVGGVRSDLSTNYTTTANANIALAAVKTELSASLQPYQAQKLHSDFRFGDFYWAASYTQSVAALPAAAYPSGAYAEVTLPVVAGIGTVLEAGPQTVNRNISERTHRPFVVGQKMRFRMKTRLTTDPTTGSHTTRFYFAMTDAAGAYLGLSAIVASFVGTVVADGWVIKEFAFDPQALKAAGAYAATAVNWRLMVQVSGLNSAVQQVEWIELEDVTTDTGLQAAITNIQAVDVSALTGTALGTLLTQLGVAAGGSSAWVTSQTSAVATLNGNAAASYSLRIGAGGASAGFEIVATDNPISGAASTVKMSAKHVDILASSVRISDSGNIFPDFDMLDPLYYSSVNVPTDGATYGFIATNSAPLGQKYLTITANAAAKSVETGWFGVETNTEYLVSGAAWLAAAGAGQGTATLTIETGSVDAAGAVTVLTTTTVVARTDVAFGLAQVASVSLITGASARRARFKLTRAAGGSGAGRGGGFKVQKKAGASLLVDGLFAVTGMAIFGGALQSTGYSAGVSGWRITDAGGAEFNNLVVRNDMIVDGAVSARAFKNFSSSVTIASTDVAATPKVIWGPFAFSPAPYVAVSGISRNPCVLSIMGDIKNNDAAAVTTAYFVLQGRNGFSGSWVNLSSDFKTLPISSGNFFGLSRRYIDVTITGDRGAFLNSYTTPYDEYRLVAYRGGGGGTGFTIDAGTSAILEQISK